MRAAKAAAEAMRERLDAPILCQGDDATGTLVKEFAEDEATSLFGTLSLWQGVDVPGPSLSLVILDRIPFPRPDDPLLMARQQAVESRGGNGFLAVAANHAALLLAQGVGRLLRSVDDKGVVAVLDSRLATARYGGYLRASLPPFWETTDPEVVRKALARIATHVPEPVLTRTQFCPGTDRTDRGRMQYVRRSEWSPTRVRTHRPATGGAAAPARCTPRTRETGSATVGFEDLAAVLGAECVIGNVATVGELLARADASEDRLHHDVRRPTSRRVGRSPAATGPRRSPECPASPEPSTCSTRDRRPRLIRCGDGTRPPHAHRRNRRPLPLEPIPPPARSSRRRSREPCATPAPSGPGSRACAGPSRPSASAGRPRHGRRTSAAPTCSSNS